MARNALRKPEVLKKTGWSNSTLYEKIAAGKFPKPVKLDPDGRAVVWFEDEVEAVQQRAVPSTDKSIFEKAVERAVERKAAAVAVADQAADEPRAA